VRALESRILVKKPTRRVWKSVASLGFCRTLTDSFWRFGRNLRYAPVRVLEDERLQKGSVVKVTTGWDRPWIDWIVSEAVPNEILVLRAEKNGWLDGYHMVIRAEIEPIDDEKCTLNLKLFVLFLNRGLEIASLFFPLAFLYRMCLNSALKKTKRAIERS
jgi:hypothetical protein